MKSSLQHIVQQFTTPPAYADPEAARIAGLLTSILNLIAVLLLLFAGVSIALGHSIALAFVIMGTLLTIVTRRLLHRGSLQTASILFVSAIWLLITVGASLFGGANGPAFSTYLLLLLIIAVIMKDRLQRQFFALTLVTATLIFMLDCLNYLPTLMAPPMDTFDGIVRLSIMGFAALMLYRVSGRLIAALESAQRNEQSARLLLDDLVKTSISKAYLDKLLLSLSDTLIVLGPDMRIERANQATQTLLGYTEADLIGKNADRIFTPEAFRWLMATLTGPVTGIETTYITRNSEIIPVSFSGSVLYNDNGGVQGIVCVAQDITDRQRTANELRQREELYRTLARNLPDMGALLFDHDLKVRIAEGSTLIEQHISTSDSEGQPLRKVVPPETVEPLTAICRRALAGEHVTLEWAYHSRTFLMHTVPVQNAADGIFGGLLLMQDITAMKQAEADLFQHLENLTSLRYMDGLISRKLDVPYVLHMALDIAIESSAARSGALLLLDENGNLTTQHTIGNCCATDDLPTVRQALAVRQAITRNGCYIAPLVSNDKTLGALCLQSDQPFSDDVCSFIELLAMRVATALDNARLYEVAQDQLAELRQLYERLSHLEQLKTDMIRIAAHDLRSPLGIITGFSEMMLESGTLSPRAEEQARHVFRAGQRMQKLITNILSLDRIEHLNSETDYNKINLAALVEAVFEDHEPLAAERKFSLQLPATRARIRGDSPQIREAVANLMTNAIKYTPRSGDITVRLYLTEEDAVFEVTDNGYGIPVELHPDLFKPFFRVQSSETRAIEGTGLGLHLVKNIIERHNGTLHFKSTYGQGSTFGFRLPLVKTDTDELAMAGAAR